MWRAVLLQGSGLGLLIVAAFLAHHILGLLAAGIILLGLGILMESNSGTSA